MAIKQAIEAGEREVKEAMASTDPSVCFQLLGSALYRVLQILKQANGNGELGKPDGY